MKIRAIGGKKCSVFKYEILPTEQQREYLNQILGSYKKGRRSITLDENSFTLRELELHIRNIPDPIMVLWNRFRPDIVNTISISQESTGRYYAVFKRDKKRESRLASYPKPLRSRQSGVGRANIHYHPK